MGSFINHLARLSFVIKINDMDIMLLLGELQESMRSVSSQGSPRTRAHFSPSQHRRPVAFHAAIQHRCRLHTPLSLVRAVQPLEHEGKAPPIRDVGLSETSVVLGAAVPCDLGLLLHGISRRCPRRVWPANSWGQTQSPLRCLAVEHDPYLSNRAPTPASRRVTATFFVSRDIEATRGRGRRAPRRSP